MATARASARVPARTPRTSTRVRRTSPRQGPRAPVELAERMVAEAILVAGAYIDRLMRALRPLLEERFGSRLDSATQRHDATSLAEVFERVQEGELSRDFLGRMFRLVDQQAANDLSRVVAIPATQTLRGANELQRQWVRNNTELIRMEARAREEVRKLIEGPLREGVRVEEVQRRIEERLGVVRSRAELVARDQTLKLYGQIQEERQTQAGIEEYTWSTAEDERVRPAHAALEGTTQRWDSPPVIDPRDGRRGHPGNDYNCRCAAIPQLPTEGISEEPPSTTRPRSLPPGEPANDVPELALPVPANDVPGPGPIRAAAAPPPAPPPPPPPEAPPPPAPPAPPAPPPSPPPPPPSEPPSGPSPPPKLEQRKTFQPREPAPAVTELWERESQQRYDRLEPEQQTAVNAFVRSEYRIFRALQQGMTPEAIHATDASFASLSRIRELQASLPALRQAQKGLSVSQPTRHGKLYRGLRLKQALLDRILSWAEFQFDATSNSASYSYETARDFANPIEPDDIPVVLRIAKVEHGAFVGFEENINVAETEVLLSDRTFHITGKTFVEDSGTYIIDLTETAESAKRADAKSPAAEFRKLTPKGPEEMGREGRFWSDGSDCSGR